MRIAVTGASGFIGTELLSELKKSGAQIVGLTRSSDDRKSTEGCEWIGTDYSADSLTKALADVNVVVHLAGVRGTTNNREDYVINETMTEALLQAMSVCNVERIVFASTISVYNDVAAIPWSEADNPEPRTMYGASKIACEQLIQDYARRDGFGYSIIRIAQVLGLGEKRRGMMNVFLDTAAAGGELKVIGKSVAKRQYIYVGDLVKIIDMLATQDGHESQIVNVGMPNAYTNYEIAELVNIVYANSTPIIYDDSQPETIKAACMDISKLTNDYGYYPMDMADSIKALK